MSNLFSEKRVCRDAIPPREFGERRLVIVRNGDRAHHLSEIRHASSLPFKKPRYVDIECQFFKEKLRKLMEYAVKEGKRKEQDAISENELKGILMNLEKSFISELEKIAKE